MSAPLVALLAWLVYGAAGTWDLLHDMSGAVAMPVGLGAVASLCLPIAIVADGRSAKRRPQPTPRRRWTGVAIAIGVLAVFIGVMIELYPVTRRFPQAGDAVRLALGTFGAGAAGRRISKRWRMV